MVLSAAAVAIVCGLTGCRAAHIDLAPFVLPEPSGASEVGTMTFHVGADPVAEREQTMAQLWYPAKTRADQARAAWLEPEVATVQAPALAQLLGVDAASIPDLARIDSNSVAGADVAAGAGVPVVVFSPGLGSTRTTSTAIAEQLASDGIAVLAVDHPGDSAAIRFPDGTIRTGTRAAQFEAAASDTDRLRMLSDDATAGRARDLIGALDLLSGLNDGGTDPDGLVLPAGLAGALDTSRVIAMGHSLGGAAALQAAADDRRIVGAVDLDGTPWGPVANVGAAVPTLVVTSADTDPATDPALSRLLGLPGQDIAHVAVPTARHYSFTDLEWFAPQLGDLGTEIVGHADPTDLHRALGALLTAFLNEGAAGKTGLVDAAITDNPILHHN
ncbi:alpha/beta hydrolase family protein [Rhodococcus sp. NPDC055112]